MCLCLSDILYQIKALLFDAIFSLEFLSRMGINFSQIYSSLLTFAHSQVQLWKLGSRGWSQAGAVGGSGARAGPDEMAVGVGAVWSPAQTAVTRVLAHLRPVSSCPAHSQQGLGLCFLKES